MNEDACYVIHRVVMYSHTYTRQPACIYSISTCMYLNSPRLQDILVLSDETLHVRASVPSEEGPGAV